MPRRNLDNPRIKQPRGNEAPAAKVNTPRSSRGSNFRQFPRMVEQVARGPGPGVDNPRIRPERQRGGLQSHFDNIVDRTQNRVGRVANRLGGEMPDVNTQGYGNGNVPPGVIEFPDGTRLGYRQGRNIPRWMGGPGRERNDAGDEPEGEEPEGRIFDRGTFDMDEEPDSNVDLRPGRGRNEDPRLPRPNGPEVPTRVARDPGQLIQKLQDRWGTQIPPDLLQFLVENLGLPQREDM